MTATEAAVHHKAEEHHETAFESEMVLIADYVAFACLAGCGMFLYRRIITFRGPTGEDPYFMGYREEKMLCVLINIFAGIGYWSRIAAREQGDTTAIQLVTLKYADYLMTCPLVTVDMLWSLNLPYKFSYGVMVFVCILCAFACDAMKGQARWMWFTLGMTLFSYVWVTVGKLVRFRFTQLAHLKEEGVLKIDLTTPLRLGTGTFFFLWMAYPLVWLLEEFELMNHAQGEVAHVVMDVLVKSVYAVMMQEFCFRCDKTYFDFPSMSLTETPPVEHARKHQPVDEHLLATWQQLPMNDVNNYTIPSGWQRTGSRMRIGEEAETASKARSLVAVREEVETKAVAASAVPDSNPLPSHPQAQPAALMADSKAPAMPKAAEEQRAKAGVVREQELAVVVDGEASPEKALGAKLAGSAQQRSAAAAATGENHEVSEVQVAEEEIEATKQAIAGIDRTVAQLREKQGKAE